MHAERSDAGEWDDGPEKGIFGPGDKHPVATAESDMIEGQAEGVGAGGTGAGGLQSASSDFENIHDVNIERAGDAVDHRHGWAFHDAASVEEQIIFMGHHRRPARAADETGAGIADLVFFEPSIVDRLAHGSVCEEGVGGHGPHHFPPEPIFGGIRPIFEIGSGKFEAFDGAKQFGGHIRMVECGVALDAVTAGAQIFENFGLGITNTGNESEPGDNGAFHAQDTMRQTGRFANEKSGGAV